MNVLYLNGAPCRDLAGVSYYNPTFLYGINCFEGIRAYWSKESRALIFLDLSEHLARLYRSAQHLSFAAPISIDQLQEHVLRIAKTEGIQEDVYVRTTFFLGGDGSWHSLNDIHYMVSFRSLSSELGRRSPVVLGVTKYRRITALSMPPFVKAGANYLNSRYALLDVRARGCDDALFLTSDGYVSEATGSTILFFKNGQIHTPSLDCDILPGITRNRIMTLCREDGLVVQEVKIAPPELASYDGAVLAGTMIEIRPVARVESSTYTVGPLHERVISLLRDYATEVGPGKCVVAF